MSSAQELPNTGSSSIIPLAIGLILATIGTVLNSIGRRGAARRKA